MRDERTVEGARERALMLGACETFIPEGMYCYSPISFEDGVLKVKICPYWASDPTKPEQSNGFCSYLNHGDWQSDGFTLLWDQVKECGRNDDVEDLEGYE